VASDEYAIQEAGSAPADQNDPLTHGAYVRLCAGLVVVAEAERLIIAGGLVRKLLTGSDAPGVATTLIPMLDGHRRLAEICAESGKPESMARQVISMLRSSGLAEYADRPFGDDGRQAAHASTFLSRSVHAAGTFRNTLQAQEALATSAVLVLARAQLAESLRADLLACGIGSVTVGDAHDIRATQAAVGAVAQWPHPLVVGVEDPSVRQALSIADTACRERGVVLLRAARYGSTAQLGPMFRSGHTACYECFNRGHDDYFAAQPAEPDSIDAPLSGAYDDMLVSLIGGEALAVLGHVRLPESYRTVVLTSLADYSNQRLTVFPYPDCPRCGDLSPSAKEPDAAAAYEWEMQAIPDPLGSAASAAAVSGLDLKGLATERASFAGRPSYPLPLGAAKLAAAAREDVPQDSPPARFGGFQLARLLARTAGRRAPGHPSDLRRWAPSGGNLASVRLFAAAAGPDFGVAAGRLTIYDDMQHRLIVARAGPVPAGRLLEGTGLTLAEPGLVLVFVADVARIARKYGRFAYRLSHSDAGVAAAQLIAVAQDLGLTVSFAPGWEPGLADLLELLPGREYITAVALLTPQEERGHCDAAHS
jgi:bacteriocin biosynthesis cyclodehydratase domain-containing protein